MLIYITGCFESKQDNGDGTGLGKDTELRTCIQECGSKSIVGIQVK